MTNKILGTSGTGVNHVHTETDPTILVHNTVPFENQEAAMAALKQKILHPGEIIVVYYNDPGADDGIASMIATGPLQSGGYNEVYKSAAEIDQLVVYLRGLIDAQDHCSAVGRTTESRDYESRRTGSYPTRRRQHGSYK